MGKQMQRPMREKDRLFQQFFTPVCHIERILSHVCVRVQCVCACATSACAFDHSYAIMVRKCMEMTHFFLLQLGVEINHAHNVHKSYSYWLEENTRLVQELIQRRSKLLPKVCVIQMFA